MPLRLITKFGEEVLGRLPSAPLDAALDGAFRGQISRGDLEGALALLSRMECSSNPTEPPAAYSLPPSAAAPRFMRAVLIGGACGQALVAGS